MAFRLIRRHPHHLFLRGAGRIKNERLHRRVNHRCARRRHRHRGVSNADFDGAGRNRIWLSIRLMADFLDHHSRRVSLQTHGQNRPVRSDSFFGLIHYRRPALADGIGRFLLRRLPGRSGGIRCAGRDYRRAAGRSGIQSALRCRAVPDRQHRACGLRRSGHSHHRRRQGHQHRSSSAKWRAGNCHCCRCSSRSGWCSSWTAGAASGKPGRRF